MIPKVTPCNYILVSLVDVGKKYYSNSEANRTLKAKSVKVCEEKLGVVIVVG